MAALVLNEEQNMLRDAAQRFFRENAPVSQLRALRDTRDETGFSTELWHNMAHMGFAGTLISEDFGGSGFGHVGMGQLFEQAGRNLSASPLFSSSVLAAATLSLAGSDEQKRAMLPAIASGNLIVTLAIDEKARHQPWSINTTAQNLDGGFVINGHKCSVVDGHVADKLIVAARTSIGSQDSDGISLFVIDPGTDGVRVERTIMADSRNAARITLDHVRVDDDALLGELNQAHPVVESVLNAGNAQLAAELLGLSLEAFERTASFLQERKQFGVVIGSFQALQHRAAHMFSELELVKSVVLKALVALDEGAPDASALVSLAKAKACEVAELVTNEMIQMHGGMGMTDEFDAGLFIKRARVVQQLLGDYRYHADRFALLHGF
ncbi:acyl-CoA dehydrogenase family protein [Pseudomonas sp. OIL-1]|uniref:acyl-CoA dehydrogenase family protein n=1 Tax=Pseudomonas sp. OIL-1 TaxID=2706126 RepID=UPI0013A76AB3|nr:acyl-CoA dehydrogenase family protein [Pseudomonas sp. OIL-1]QIB49962.1 acyl-CoA dehydrogenase family protein [Pseudomonas sp. OIL-1]